MRLNTLQLTNFCGIKSFTLDIDGNSVEVHGQHEAGKSTLRKAFIWLLTGKSPDNKAFDPKPIRPDGTESHGIDTEVISTFDNGIILKRMQVEMWVKKRGLATKEYSGNKELFYVNEVPVKASEYKSKVAELIGSVDILKQITNPHYVGGIMAWKERRSLLMGLCDVVSTEDVVAVNSDFEPLLEPLSTHLVTDYMKVLNERLKLCNDDRARLPGRIDEVNFGMPEIEGLVFDDLKARSDELVTEAKDLKEKKAELKKDKIEEAILKLGIERDQRLSDHRKAVKAAETEVELIRREIGLIDREIGQIDNIRPTLLRAAGRFDDLTAEAASLRLKPVCPTCGQLTDPKLCADKIASLEAEAGGLQEQIFRMETSIKKITGLTEAREELKVKLVAAQEKLDETVDGVPGTLDLTNKITSLKQKLDTITEDRKEISTKLNELKIELDGVREQMGRFATVKKCNARLLELQGIEKEITDRLCDTEREKFLLEEFIRTGTKMALEPLLASIGIEGVSVTMFEDQLNGGLKSCCEITYKGVPYGLLNTAAQIAIGLRLIERLNREYNIELPVFVDNAESCYLYPEVDFQLIKLVVNPEATGLEIFIDEND